MPQRLFTTIDRYHWLWLLLAAPLLLFPAPARSFALLVVPALWLLAWLARRPALPPTPLNGALLVFALALLVSVFATFDLLLSFPKIAGLVLGIGAFFAVVRLGAERRGWAPAAAAFLLVGAGVAVVALLGTRWNVKIGALAPLVTRLPRLFALPGAEEGFHPNEVAGALLWVLPGWAALAGWLVWRRAALAAAWGRGRWRAALAGALGGTAVVGFTLLLTQSRGAYLALALTALLLGGPLLPRGRRVYLAVLVVLLLALGGAIARYGLENVLGAVFGGAASDSQVLQVDNLNGRFELWSRALLAIQDFPFTGIGLNTFSRVIPELYPLLLDTSPRNIPHAHNELLEAAVDLGIAGLVALGALYVGAAAQLAARWRAAAPAERLLVLGLAGGLLAHALYGLTDAVALGAKPGLLFWWLLALSVSGPLTPRSRSPAPTPGSPGTTPPAG